MGRGEGFGSLMPSGLRHKKRHIDHQRSKPFSGAVLNGHEHQAPDDAPAHIGVCVG